MLFSLPQLPLKTRDSCFRITISDPSIMMASSSSSSSVGSPSQHQVFLNFRGKQLRNGFVSHLEKALRRDGVNVFIDRNESRGKDLSILFSRIEESRIALAIFSSMYTESDWCLNELEKIKERVDLGKLVVIPIFYKVETDDVKHLKGEFGDKFWELVKTCKGEKLYRWKEALNDVPRKLGFTLSELSDEGECINQIVREVIKVLFDLEREIPTDNPCAREEETPKGALDLPPPLFSRETQVKELEEKFNSEFPAPVQMALSSSSALEPYPYVARALKEETSKAAQPALDLPPPLFSRETQVKLEEKFNSEFPAPVQKALSSSTSVESYPYFPRTPVEFLDASMKEKKGSKGVLGKWCRKIGEGTQVILYQSVCLLVDSETTKDFLRLFKTVPEEQLTNTHRCKFSTSAGPVEGVLYISTAKIAFCSFKPLPYESSGQTESSYYKLVIPLHQLKSVNPSKSILNPGKKYIQLIGDDDQEFWFMSFMDYKCAVKFLEDALQAVALHYHADAEIGSTKVVAECPYEKIFRQTFETVPEEQLQKSYVCFLLTTIGPIIGELFISTAKLAYCSDNPLFHQHSGKTEWGKFKVVVPLHQLKSVNRTPCVDYPAKKCIQVIYGDDKEYCFLDFLNYEGAITSLQDKLQTGA